MDKLYLDRLVKSVTNNIGIKPNNMMFIKHYNSLSISGEEILAIVQEDNIKTLFFEYDIEDMQEAYDPFFSWIRDIYYDLFSDSMTIVEFLRECNVYPQFEEVFSALIIDGKCIRTEDIIISEIIEERIYLYDSLTRIFDYISNRVRLFMVISKIHLANYSSVDWLFQFFNEYQNKNIGFFIIYNEAYPITSYTQSIFKKFLDMVELNNYYFDWDTVSTEKIIEKQAAFLPNRHNIKEYIVKINNMYYLHATKEAIFYLEIINQSLERDKLKIDIEDKYVLYALYALISISAEDYNTAIILMGNYIYNDELDSKYAYWFNYIYGLAHISLLQVNMALKSADKCLELANKMDDEKLIFKAEYLRCIAINYNWSQMFLVDFLHINVTEEFIDNLKKYNYNNALAYVYAYSFENDQQTIDAYAKGEIKELEYFEKGIEIGKRLRNTTFLRSAYMKNILLYSGAGYQEISNRFHERRLEIVKLEKSRLREGHVYNGMGFNCIIVEKYNQADQYFNQAVEIYIKFKAVNNLAEALYNSATNSLLAGDFENAYVCIDTIIYILDKMELQSVQMCNASKLYGIAALSCYYLDQTYKSIVFVNKMELVMSHILMEDDPDYTNWYEDLCFYYLIKGILARENNASESLRLLKQAERFQENVKGNRFITYSFLAIEMAKTYRLLRQESNAKKVLDNAIQYSMKKGYSSKARILISHLGGNRKMHNSCMCGLKKVTYNDIKKIAKSEGNRLRLEGREKDINRLSKWQEVLKVHSKDTNKLIYNTMTSIINTFNLDGGIYIEFEDGDYCIKFCDDKYEYNADVVNAIVSYFIDKPKTFFVNRIDKKYNDYAELVNIFGVNNIATLIGIPLIDNMKIKSIFLSYVEIHRNFTANKKLMNEDSLNMIRTAFEQLVLAYYKNLKINEIELINEKLKEMSYTDALTGLYNRQGLIYSFEKSIEDTDNNIVMYIDLDDFKSYNDVYGHAIGDHVLVYFADILKKNVNKYGYGVRYGGDEFLAVLRNVSKDEIEQIIVNIRDSVKCSITNILRKHYKGNAIIPDNKEIACSIGIADFDRYTYDSMSEALTKADKALYHIKNNNKGKSISWNEL